MQNINKTKEKSHTIISKKSESTYTHKLTQEDFSFINDIITLQKEVITLYRTDAQDGGMGKHILHPHTTTAKITFRLQNKHHPESPEYQAVWKSDNQGIKEATFIQMGRRGQEVERAVTHPHMVRKNWEGQGYPSPTPEHPAWDSSARQVKSP